jgi:hypothetical protein
MGDIWSRLWTDVQHPTQLLASGTACPTIRYAPLSMVPSAGRTDDNEDQLELTPFRPPPGTSAAQDRNAQFQVVDPDGFYLPANIQGQMTSGPNGVAALTEDVIQSFLFPWEFYVVGQQALARLAEIKPPDTASVEERMVWTVDVAWWITMMMGATNIYPTWWTSAVLKMFGRSWVQGGYVSPERDAELLGILPFKTLGLDSVVDSYPYRVPFARNPGEFNTHGTLRGQGAFSVAEHGRIKRIVNAQPWITGVQVYGDITADRNRARQEDPSGAGGVLRAAEQHSFFRPSIAGGTFGVPPDFFGMIAQIKSNPAKLEKFNTGYSKLLPAWTAIMLRTPYWSFVRAGVDAFRETIQSTFVTTRSDMGPDAARIPFGRPEIADLKDVWEEAEREAHGMLGLQAALQTAVAIIAAYNGAYPHAQLAAFEAWHATATFRYGVARAWERAWEIHPVLMRLYPAYGDCDCLTIPPREGLARCRSEVMQYCSSGPDVRFWQGGGLLPVHIMQNLQRIEQRGGLWLLLSTNPSARSTAMELLSELPDPPDAPDASLPPAGPAGPQWAPTAMREGKSSNMGVLAAVGAVLLGVGIIIATRGRR